MALNITRRKSVKDFAIKASLAFAGSSVAIGAFAVLPGAAPAHADSCFQWAFNGRTGFHESSGWEMWFNSTGTTAQGRVDGIDLGTGGYPTSHGTIEHGSVVGHGVDITVRWDSGTVQRFTGTVVDGKATGSTNNPDYQTWYPVGNPLTCIDQELPPAAPQAPAQQPAPPDTQTAAARLGVAVNGPKTLLAGQSGTYTVSVSNSGDVNAPVELFISFNGQLQQAGFTPSGGLDCDVRNYGGGSSSVHCTTGQLPAKGTANIVVQGRGSAPGAATLGVNINSSDPAAQFVQKSQQLNVTIT
ncbi:hypothetical protein GGC64_005937 [Mycobacterium sp. OAS707]|uniref:hypothetical protein n=1 Tax=Mycobacterium sp. OAS707 TaxID=2663822 RepID=UPI00178A3166|nr:hypothetical protein [Mycobacterium sp. OAS707]MBE1551850.1 hypothetical protein [Mycobacterium sp. OAS707]